MHALSSVKTLLPRAHTTTHMPELLPPHRPDEGRLLSREVFIELACDEAVGETTKSDQ